jgi:predicted PurR-regulated permease PerM
MNNNSSSLSNILKYLQIILISAAILYFAKILLIPLFFGLLVAIVMYPVCKWFEKFGWNKSLAITACLLIVTIIFAALVALLVWQVKLFSKDAPAILNRLENGAVYFQNWLKESMGLSVLTEIDWKKNIVGLLSGTLQTTFNTLFILFLTPVFTALFMYHRKIFVQYLRISIPIKYSQKLDAILQQTINTYFNYIKGMLLVYLIVGILNSIGLLALGVNHAVLFGMLCAIMTIIPYIGIVISALLPISVVWMQTENIWYPVGVVGVFSFVQYLEANVIFPKVVGTQLHVSTLSMLVAILAGGIIWGTIGMVLFIPFVAILKIISDHIEEWKPINLLLSRTYS